MIIQQKRCIHELILEYCTECSGTEQIKKINKMLEHKTIKPRMANGKYAKNAVVTFMNKTGVFLSIAMTVTSAYLFLTVKDTSESFLSPLGAVQEVVASELPTPTPTMSILEQESIYVANAVDEFIPVGRVQQKSEAIMIMHCLLHRESVHGFNFGQGDNGKANGALQYWEGTWIRVRKGMIKQGVANEIGNSLDVKEAIRSTVWVMWESRKDKKERVASISEWGPIYREITGYKYSDKPGCQVPSWFNNN